MFIEDSSDWQRTFVADFRSAINIVVSLTFTANLYSAVKNVTGVPHLAGVAHLKCIIVLNFLRAAYYFS